MQTRTAVPEFLGTLPLVFFGVGSAVLGAEYPGTAGIALSFGFVLLALACALGPISGCPLTSVVTPGMLTARRIDVRTADPPRPGPAAAARPHLILSRTP